MSLAAATRDAVRERPFLRAALRAGIVNYTAAADWLVERDAVDGDREAVATALRRFAADLPVYATEDRRASVSMHSGVALETESATDDDALIHVGDAAVVSGGSKTAILATGAVDARALTRVLGRLDGDEIEPHAASVAVDTLAVLVDRRAGADAVRIVEDALDAVPAGEPSQST